MSDTKIISSIEKEEYKKWIVTLCDDYRKSQIKAFISVNSEMLQFYWRLGRKISVLHFESTWGSKFLGTLSNDLKKLIPNAKCFSERNLKYMERFYELFPDEKVSMLDVDTCIILPQLGAELFSIPRGHIGTYITAVNHILKGDKDEPTIGLLICKTKDNVLAQYAAESSYQPIGISEYQLSNMIEESHKGTLPSIKK